MANCPFHRLAVGHTELVCRLNYALLDGFVDSIAPDLLQARLEPGADRCCVTLAAPCAVKVRAASPDPRVSHC
jgi:predicted ArsR family transcriptional regulator